MKFEKEFFKDLLEFKTLDKLFFSILSENNSKRIGEILLSEKMNTYHKKYLFYIFKYDDEVNFDLFQTKMELFEKVVSDLKENTNNFKSLSKNEIISNIELIEKKPCELKNIKELIFYNRVNKTNFKLDSIKLNLDSIKFLESKAILVDELTYRYFKTHKSFYVLNIKTKNMTFKVPGQGQGANAFSPNFPFKYKFHYQNLRVRDLPVSPFESTRPVTVIRPNLNGYLRNSNFSETLTTTQTQTSTPTLDDVYFLSILKDFATSDFFLQNVETVSCGFIGFFTGGISYVFLNPSAANNYRPITKLIEGVSSHL